MAEETKPSETIAHVIKQAEIRLAGIDSEPFSAKAFEALKRSIAWFIGELVDESVKVSKRHRSDNVAESHVEAAALFLVGDTTRRLFRHLGTIGGIFFGAALSNFLSMITNRVLTLASVGITVALAVIGAFLVALHIARD
jgi:hypothetical protein